MGAYALYDDIMHEYGNSLLRFRIGNQHSNLRTDDRKTQMCESRNASEPFLYRDKYMIHTKYIHTFAL